MTKNVLVDFFIIFCGVRAAVPLQFDPWERWPGALIIVLGIGSLIIHAFD